MRDERRRFIAEKVVDGALEARDELWGHVERQLPANAPKATRMILKGVKGGPAILYSVGKAMSADTPRDQARGLAGAAGGFAGGLAGSAFGPVGSLIASEAGTRMGEYLFDAGAEIHDELEWREENRRRMEETKRVNDARNAAQRRNGR
jgi:hypothetical protein